MPWWGSLLTALGIYALGVGVFWELTGGDEDWAAGWPFMIWFSLGVWMGKTVSGLFKESEDD